MDLVDTCPMVVVERILGADLTSGENSTLFSFISGASELDCQVLSVAAIADRLNAQSHPGVIGDFCGSVATYARFLSPGARDSIRAAYLRFPYSDDIALAYFSGLRLAGIDIRDHLRGRIAVDWSFAHPRQGATWQYYLYLASLGEPGALDALVARIAATENGNDATNLLASLSDLPGQGVTDILRSYAGDSRRSDGTEGPGMMISEMVAMYLSLRPAD